jgi:hypothetical protein
MRPGTSADWLMTVERSGESIRLMVSDLQNPAEREEYDGTVKSDVLTVPVEVSSSAGYCGARGGRGEYQSQSELVGRFSDQGQVLTADEVYALRFTSGETLTYRLEWRATRQ